MLLRGAIVAVWLIATLAIGNMAVIAVRGERPASSYAERVVRVASAVPVGASDTLLAEGGPHHVFRSGAHARLRVDIGNADLTILTGNAGRIDVGVLASSAFGLLRATAPLTARADGETIRISVSRRQNWTVGDDRMVTVVLPPETEVTVASAGDIQASGLRAEASLTSIGGGSVTVRDYDASTLRVAASHGRILLHRIVAAHLDVACAHGRVEADALRVRDGRIESEGRMKLGFAAAANTLVTAQTDNGRIGVSGFTKAPSLATEPASSIAGAGDGASRTVRIGAGDGHFDVHSSDGNVTLWVEG